MMFSSDSLNERYWWLAGYNAGITGALPLDPALDEVSLAIGLAVHDVNEFPAKTYLARVGQAARRALRASLLPGEEPS